MSDYDLLNTVPKPLRETERHQASDFTPTLEADGYRRIASRDPQRAPGEFKTENLDEGNPGNDRSAEPMRGTWNDDWY